MKYIFTFSALLFIVHGSVSAQDLDRLRQAPQKEGLPVNAPELKIEEVVIPQSTLDLKVDYWRTWTSFGINANQASFSENWNGGGVNSISVGGFLDRKSTYTKDDKNFTTQLILNYGMLKNKDQLSRKSNDRIFWDNKAGFKLSKAWSLFASLAVETQFVEGYNYYRDAEGNDTRSDNPISNFMAPGYITESVGIEYTPDKTFSLRFGTGTARQTLILDERLVFEDRKSFGVDTGKNFRNELAFQLVANLNRNLSENVNITSRYAFFANYNEFGKASHRLDATLTSRVSRIINVSLSGILWYDKNIDEKVQTSQTLALGIMYKFPR